MAAGPVGGGGAWPGFEATRRATSATWRHWCGGHRRDPWAWLRCPWAAAEPGQASHSDLAPQVWRAPEGSAAVPVGGGGAWPGFEATRRAKLAARTARGRAAAHGHTKQPGLARHTTQAPDPKAPEHQRCHKQQNSKARVPEGQAAVPMGGGGAWPGFETTRRAKLAARTARGRAAAHRHTQRPSPPAPRTPVGHQATKQPRNGNARQPQRATARSRSQWNTQRSRAATTSATWTAFRAAPLRRLSPETTSTSPRLPSTAWS